MKKLALMFFLMMSVFLGTTVVVCAQQAVVDLAFPIKAEDCTKGETTFGNITADSLKYALNTDIALVDASQISQNDSDIEPGKISYEDFLSMLSYPDEKIVTVNLKGSSLLQALEKSVSLFPQKNQGFLQISGVSFKYDPSRQMGNRIISIKIGSSDIDQKKIYTVAMTKSLANGAMGYWKYWGKNDIKSSSEEKTIAQSISDYFDTHKKITKGDVLRIEKVSGK